MIKVDYKVFGMDILGIKLTRQQFIDLRDAITEALEEKREQY